MRGIYFLITRFYVLILFVVFEIFALSLIYKSHKYQEIKFLNTSNYVSGTFLGYINNIESFFHLNSNNKVLAEENIRLKKQIEYQNLYLYNLIFSNV